MDDTHDRDQESQKFHQYATDVAETYRKINVAELSIQERGMLDKLFADMQYAYPLQNELIDEAVFKPDYDRLKNKLGDVMKAQADVMVQLDNLALVQRQGAEQAVMEAQASYSEARLAMMYLGSLTFFLGMVIAVLVVRLTRRQEMRVQTGIQALKKEHDTLEQRILVRTEELAEARDKAMSANRAKGQFLANMSHELRTPLNAIIGYSEIIQEDIRGLGQEALSADVAKIQSAGRHLLSLINEVLDLSKIEAGKMEVYIEQFEIKELLEDIITNTAPLVVKNNNKLKVVEDGRPGLMTADMTKIRQILLNLVSNASKFTKDGNITLEVARENINEIEWIKFSITDSGIGMTEGHLDQLFSPFEQGDLSTTRKYGGTGLGLTISKYFTEMMGGKIEVNSIPGEGSQFTVYIPAVITAAQPEEIKHKEIEADPVDFRQKLASTVKSDRRSKICTVLVIDDDASVRDMIARYMTKDGFRVEVAASGREGLQLAKKLNPDVITLDVMMPSMDGWSVLKELKNNEATTHIPVIMLSMIDDRTLGFALGATDYLTKPINWKRMSTVIKQSVRNLVGKHVLIVEDDLPAQEMTRRMLEKEGLKVITCVNGLEAVEQVRKNKPDLILLDLMMPVMDGFEFMKELKENEEWKTIPVVILTAADISASERKLLQGSVQKIIRKAGLDKKSLMEEVGSIMKTRYAEHT
jgi:signal transduction histidine kinase/CheY-like chemotaxis protein